MKEARITINPRGIGVLAFRLSSRRLSAPITTAALLGSVGAGSAFARPARNASDNELTSLWSSRPEIASPSWPIECHKNPPVLAIPDGLATGEGAPNLAKMGFFRFRKSIPLGKFFRINLSKTGTSLSAGRPGATVNVRKDRVDGTVGIPGSGLSYKERLANRGCASVFIFALMLSFALAGVVAWAR